MLLWLGIGLLVAPGLGAEGLRVRYLGSRVQGEGALVGLEGAQAAALAPDGRFLYTTGPGARGVVVFEIDDLGGLRQRQLFASDGPEGEFRGAFALTISPDGHHLYVVSHRGRLAAFRRDPEQGTLALVELLVADGGVLEGLRGGADVVVSPEGTHLYVGSHLHGIVVFRRKPKTGRLRWLRTFPGDERPPRKTLEGSPGAAEGGGSLYGLMDLALGAEGRELFVAGGRRGWIARLAREPKTGRLRLLQLLESNTQGIPFLGTVTAVAPSPPGDRLFVAGESPDAIAVLKREASGDFRFESSLTALEHPELVLPFSLTLDRSGRYLYAAGSSSGSALLTLEWDGSLKLRQSQGPRVFEPMLAPARWILSPEEDFAYGILDGVAVCRRDVKTGRLHPLSIYRDGGGVSGLARVSALAVSPDGKHIYTAGDGGQIGIFEELGDSLPPHYLGAVPVDGLEEVATLAVSSDGTRVVAVDRAGVSFRLERDPRSGDLRELVPGPRPGPRPGPPSGPAPPRRVRRPALGGDIVSPVGKGEAGGISSLSKTGRPEIPRRNPPRSPFAEGGRHPPSKSRNTDSQGRPPGLTAKRDPTRVSTLGSPVEVRRRDGKILFLAADPKNGEPTPLPWDPTGISSPDLKGDLALAISPDGRRIYLTARGSHSLSAFAVEAPASGPP